METAEFTVKLGTESVSVSVPLYFGGWQLGPNELNTLAIFLACKEEYGNGAYWSPDDSVIGHGRVVYDELPDPLTPLVKIDVIRAYH